jgi:pyruvate ferredoxin oxidoreductase delta subunit
MKLTDRLHGWKELPIGGIIPEGGTSKAYKTGNWRTGKKPVWHPERCIQCLFCWIYCPDDAIFVTEDGKRADFNYDYCKGCGICARECPAKPEKAIEMVDELR